ncbi:MAG TPA: PQQ-binding-like beta-propeller repeat protein [Steroidobacteraceae bacterium]|nr:PQQ-binding-like beta-propeller repeat protein [Steroidobacteraceae bacterium]
MILGAYTSEIAVRLVHTLAMKRRILIVSQALALGWLSSSPAAEPRPIAELAPLATVKLGQTADWVAITADAVWVASTGPFAVHRIDPKTNRLAASVNLPGEPCAGLAVGSGSLWVPLCTAPTSLAKVNLKSSRLVSIFPVGPAAAEGGIAYGAGSVWLIVNKSGDLARIEPGSGKIVRTYRLPAGSYNPIFADGTIWVSRAEGAELTGVDAATGKVRATVATGPNPRFLTAGAGAIWTLDQGDGNVTRVERSGHAASSIALGTPGHGGDIAFSAGRVWTTMPKMPLSVIDAAAGKLICQWAGPGGDSLGIGYGAIWLTDYHAGTVSRIPVEEALAKCSGS